MFCFSSSEPPKTVQSDDHEAGPSDSTLSLTLMPSWIKDEDNREEHPSSFNKLGKKLLGLVVTVFAWLCDVPLWSRQACTDGIMVLSTVIETNIK